MRAISLALLALGLSLSYAKDTLRATTPRRLSYEMIANYEPSSVVTDHNAIDLDQQKMEEELANEAFDKARHFYQDGAHSKPYAELTLDTLLTEDIPADTEVKGLSHVGVAIGGRLLNRATAGSNVIQVRYHISQVQETYVGCQVGALWRVHEANLDGCFADTGTLEFADREPVTYTYDIRKGNLNGRTLAGFSTTAATTMRDCPNCPYSTFIKFNNYYGVPEYGDQFVQAALDGTATTFEHGNNDFSTIGKSARAEAVKKGSAYMNVWMYVIREMEDALDDCVKGDIEDNDNGVHAWDEAVAFFTGSLEGRGGNGNGVLIYSLANKRCANFRTCGVKGNENSGHAKLNHDIRRLFRKGLQHLQNGQCEEAREVKVSIENLMTVPLVQGAIRYAHIRSFTPNDSKAAAEGASFAAAILPIVHHCKPQASDAIYDNLKLAATSTSFSEVKNAFEESYACMGITCEEVGGYYDETVGDYYEGAAPCTGSGTSSSKATNAVGIAIGVTAGVVVVVLGAMFFLRRRRNQKMATELPPPPKTNPIFVSSEQEPGEISEIH